MRQRGLEESPEEMVPHLLLPLLLCFFRAVVFCCESGAPKPKLKPEPQRSTLANHPSGGSRGHLIVYSRFLFLFL